MTLLWPVGMIFPVAVATISTWLRLAQAKPSTNRPMRLSPIARPMGEGGVSTISSAAGRNASSSRSRGLGPAGKRTTFFSAFMKSYLKRQVVALFAGDEVNQQKDQGFNWPKHWIGSNYLRLHKPSFMTKVCKTPEGRPKSGSANPRLKLWLRGLEV